MEIQRPKSKQAIPPHAKLVFKGILFDTYQWEQELYDGTKTIFEKIKRPDSVAVLPVLSNGNILFTIQSQPRRDEFIDSPSGRVDEGEDVLSAAKRELIEETGYVAKEYILWKAVHPTTKVDWVVYEFIAKGCEKLQDQNIDSGEKIELREYSFDEMLDLAHVENFRNQEVIKDFLEAKIFPEKMQELKELFKPIEK